MYSYWETYTGHMFLYQQVSIWNIRTELFGHAFTQKRNAVTVLFWLSFFIIILIIIELHLLAVVLFSALYCNRPSTHSGTPTASRFRNNISLRHADAGGDEVPHYTPPISPFPPHSSPTSLPSGPRGRDALMHMHTRLDKFTVSVGEFFFCLLLFLSFFWISGS